MKLRHILGATALAASVATLSAQDSYSGYFLDNYLYRYEMNPAYGNESNFVGFPGLGNVNIGAQGNLHLSDVIYNVNGKTALFTNPNVSTTEALSKFHDRNRLEVNTKLRVLNTGFKAFGGYNTVGLNVNAEAAVSLPGSVFSLLKEGVANKTYSIENLRAKAIGYAELAFNHSREIKQVPGLRVGAGVKLLFGVANLDADFKDAHLELGEDNWHVQSQADLYAALSRMKFKYDYNDVTGTRYVSGVDLDGAGLNGFGLGFDLGATYKWNDFKFSAALLDLGFISWSNSLHASTNGVKTFDTDRYEFDVTGDDKDENGHSAWVNLRDDFAALYQLEDDGKTSRTTALAATMNLGVEYEFPYYRRLHFGLLSTTRFDGPYTWGNVRISANVRPVDILSASLNMEAGTFGCGLGWMLNLNLRKGFSLFVGMDHTLGKVTKQMAPLNSNAKFNFGIDFPF